MLKQTKRYTKKILIFQIGYVTIKDSKNVKINRVNPLYLIFNEVNGYFGEINGNKYLTIAPTNQSKEKIKKYEKLIKFNSDDELPLNKTIEIPSMTIVVRAIFLENDKYYPQDFLCECLYKYKI